MTEDRVGLHFEHLRMTPADAASRSELVRQVEDGFLAAVGAPALWRWFVPGRIEIFGKHTDYAGGRSLLAAIPRGIALAAAPRDDAIVRVIDIRDGQRALVNTADPDTEHVRLARYVQVVARRFAANFPGASLGVDIALASDLPRAAGLSSSSALVVGIASVLIRRAALTTRAEWQQNITSIQEVAWYLGCVENGLDYRGLCGSNGVGTMGGSQDHTAILACRAEHVSQYRFVPVTHLGDSPMPAGWRFVVASSGIQADKAEAVREQYNRASRGTRALLDLWNARASEPALSLGSALAAAPQAVTQLRRWIAPTTAGPFSVDDLERRLTHFVREDGRIPEAARAFHAADAGALGRLAAESQRDANDLLGNQIPETRALAALAREAGAFAATSFGAGFGGSVWALVGAPDATRFARAWVAAYTAATPTAAGVEWFIARPGPPLTELPAV